MTFESKYTDEKLLSALEKCLSRAAIPASQIAEELEGNSEYVKKKLLELEKRGLIKSKKVGSSWCFRPIK
jgi:predicted ArsR family transcriptional regulator